MTAPARARSPARPGAGPLPDALLRRLEVELCRRVQALLAGDHRSLLVGRGYELAEIRPYVPGDDVRRIDWNVTARTGEPHVRADVAERALTTWLLLDTSASMSFGTADRRKADVAEGVALVFGHLGTRGANRIGVTTFGGPHESVWPPRPGRAGLLGLLLALREEPPRRGGGATSVGRALEAAARSARRSGVVVLVGDLRGPRDWQAPLLRLAARHDVIVVEVRDPREQALPDVGDVWLVDPETGRTLRVDTSSRTVRERFAAHAAGEREEIADAVRATGAGHVLLTTEGDWLRELGSFLRRRGARR